jgi:hypothetical protein
LPFYLKSYNFTVRNSLHKFFKAKHFFDELRTYFSWKSSSRLFSATRKIFRETFEGLKKKKGAMKSESNLWIFLRGGRYLNTFFHYNFFSSSSLSLITAFCFACLFFINHQTYRFLLYNRLVIRNPSHFSAFRYLILSETTGLMCYVCNSLHQDDCDVLKDMKWSDHYKPCSPFQIDDNVTEYRKPLCRKIRQTSKPSM